MTLLHVVPHTLPIRARRRAEKEARTALASEAAHVARSLRADVSIAHEVCVGAPAAEIVDRAARLQADLVVMGRGAGRPLRDSLLGSTAERVLRHARMPVLAVRLPVRTPYRRPALGIELDDAAAPVLAMLFRVIPPPRPPVAIIHAHDAPYLGMVYAGLSADEIEEEEHRHRQRVAPRIAEIVGRALRAQKRDRGAVPPIETYIRSGDPRHVIETAVKKLGTDLLLLGTHGYSGVAHLFLGTVAGDVLREVRCDVLVVPPGQRTSG
jgi:nucleotide-binding universal stress UspA family protein